MVGGPCDFSVSPSPLGPDFGTLDFGTSDWGLTTSCELLRQMKLCETTCKLMEMHVIICGCMQAPVIVCKLK